MPTTSLRAITWMGWLFAVGSTCFAVGVPLSLNASLVLWFSAAVFFVGALFFTAASTIQGRLAWREVSPQERALAGKHVGRVLRIRNLDWASAWIQWVGTIFFISTTLRTLLDATGATSPSATQIWRPDAIGSILFLVSSGIALIPEVNKRRHGHARDRAWAIAAVNMLGSIFFGISAVGAYVEPSTGQIANLGWADGGTFLGAVCFLVGALMVLPRRGDRVLASPPPGEA